MGGSTSKNSKSEQKQTESQTNAPPAWSQALFQQGASDALSAYQNGQGGNVYQGQRVADLSDTTKSAIDGLANSANNFDNDYLRQLMNNPTSSASNLTKMASGDLIGNNSAFNEALQNTLNNTATTINSQMAGAGRYGSGAHSGVLANNLGQVATSALSNQYNQDVKNMLTANSQIDSANQGQVAGAANYLGNESNAWRNALNGGQTLDDNAQAQVDADWQKWLEDDNRDWSRLNLLQNAATGFSGNYGTSSGSSQSQTTKKPSLLDTAKTVGGLIGKSDIRAKENIVQIGNRNGYPLYEFNYCGQPQRYRGVMAQDVLSIKPQAVLIDESDGLYCVDYSEIGFAMELVH
ncbi:tail fiber domain-containing protein [Bartonella sp. HY761]|uniref:tail fiber domain-containing protein n=1 Tax=Bartonella sp. HY761 TaxID=2979330 RepID=UPI0022061509|nr:tail fiber domain-containing protein [Bartonella sp. HY761]UXN06080.1 tail fiber domain-containing protein [Bartonella sp. HY761]